MKFDDHENEDLLEVDRHGPKEVAGPDPLRFLPEERLPGHAVSGRVSGEPLQDVLNRPLRDAKSQLQEFAPDLFRSPGRVLMSHSQYVGANLGGDLPTIPDEPGTDLPVDSKSFSVPLEKGLGSDDREGRSPARKCVCEEAEKGGVLGLEEDPAADLPPEDDQLLPEEKVLHDEVRPSWGEQPSDPRREEEDEAETEPHARSMADVCPGERGMIRRLLAEEIGVGAGSCEGYPLCGAIVSLRVLGDRVDPIDEDPVSLDMAVAVSRPVVAERVIFMDRSEGTSSDEVIENLVEFFDLLPAPLHERVVLLKARLISRFSRLW